MCGVFKAWMVTVSVMLVAAWVLTEDALSGVCCWLSYVSFVGPQEIAHRVQAVLEFTASDGAKGSGSGGLPTLLTHRAYRDAPEPVRRYLQYALREGQPQLK